MKHTTALLLLLLLFSYTFPGTSIEAKTYPRALPIPVTTEDIIELSAAGVSDEIIISQLKATQSIFYLTNKEIIELKQAGVSDAVVDCMVKTSTSIPRAILVEEPINVRYRINYGYDPWYDYWWWDDPWYDDWRWRRRRWRRPWRY